VVINCDLPWNPAKLEQRIARAWRKHQKNAVTVLNLIARDTLEHRMLATLDAKRTLADGVLDLKGDLDEVPLRLGGQSFLQRLEQTFSTTPAAAPAPAEKKPAPPADPAEAFSLRAAALLGSRLVACAERYPDGEAPRVLVVTVDRDADTWQPRLAELHATLFAAEDPLAATRLEVLDRATLLALERLEAAGIIRSCVRATRHLHPTGTTAVSPLSDEEKSRTADFRRQAAKKLKLAKILLAEDLADEATTALRESARLTGCAFAVEERTATLPADLATALAPPLSYRWGVSAAKMAVLVTRAEAPSIEVIAELNGVLEEHGG
jgi:hypothetical protein